MKPGWKGVALGLAAAVALGAVFASYLQPDLVMSLANQLWSCF